VDVGRKMRIGKFAFARAESGEIETQHTNSAHRQPLGNTPGREVIFAAGKTVCKQRESQRLAEWQVDQRRQFLAPGIGKLKPTGAHREPPSVSPSPQYVCASHAERPTRLPIPR